MSDTTPLATAHLPGMRPHQAAAHRLRDPLTIRSLRTFLLATFALSWGTGMVMIAFAEQVEAVFGPMGYTNPVLIFVVYAPGIVGVVMVWRHYGRAGLAMFLRRLTMWRMSLAWWATLAIGMPAVFYLGALINGTAREFAYVPWYAVLPALVPALLIGPIEELGWRGVALPLLQRRFAPLWAGLILGVVSALWHMPAFLLSGTKQSAWAMGPFLLGVVAISVILTAMFNAARGSLLVAVLFHFQMNGPAWPDAQPWDMYLFAVVAVLVVLINHRAMLAPEGAATEVLLAAQKPAERGSAPSAAPVARPSPRAHATGDAGA
jgi:uncharacterized protein